MNLGLELLRAYVPPLMGNAKQRANARYYQRHKAKLKAKALARYYRIKRES